MEIKPIYAENIIVAIIYKNKFKWYVTDKELWFMDYYKLEEAYMKIGFVNNDSYEPEERKGLQVLDDNNADDFILRIDKYAVTKDELYYLLKEKVINGDEEVLDFCPALMVDFDKRVLYSLFPEPASYEKFVPKEWCGEYTDFTKYIPNEERYWLDEFNNNMLIKENME